MDAAVRRRQLPPQVHAHSVSVLSASEYDYPNGKLYNFDESGNPKAMAALQKSRKGSTLVFSYWKTGKATQPIIAHVTGSVTSDVLNLDTIRID